MIIGTQEEAAEAYDIAAIKFRGVNAVTNFDITRYDVERIMASNTLLAGELARRNKEIGPGNESPNHNPSAQSSNGEAIPLQRSVEGEQPDWKMVFYQSSQQLEQKVPNILDNYKPQTFSLAPDVIGMTQQEMEDSAKMGNHLSNASSLVTSLSNSREGSPDRSSVPMLLPVPRAISKLSNSPTSTVNSWVPSAELRPPLSMPHMPVFAAWTDS